MSAERDGHRVSETLTHARTVLSRAETAKASIVNRMLSGREYDPAAAEILAALDATIEALAPFRRTTRRKNG